MPRVHVDANPVYLSPKDISASSDGRRLTQPDLKIVAPAIIDDHASSAFEERIVLAQPVRVRTGGAENLHLSVRKHGIFSIRIPIVLIPEADV